ncbi:MAG: type II secretion system minor pseudopilin GspK [Candidatus Competibacteraceae bacterium]|nr:type II secretion system minor pseudopilin GspK [Candidatus Competibacteraceae bacterium]
MSPPIRQRGVALLTVMVVVFLATVAAVALARIQTFTLQRSTVLLHQQQALHYARGGESWAARILIRDREDGQRDHLEEDWAQLPPALPIEGGYLQGSLEDLQGRYNLNNLLLAQAGDPDPEAPPTDDQSPQEGQPTEDQPPPQEQQEERDPQKEQIEILTRLLEQLELDPAIAQALADWLDPDQEPRFPDGAEDGEYLGRDPPYPAANRLLTSVSELRLIKGVDAESFDKLSPYVTALPVFTAVNVNTAQAPVLSALVEGLDLMRSEALVEARPPDGYESTRDFLDAIQVADSPLTRDNLVLGSDYFLLRVEAVVGEGRANLTSILARPPEGAIRILLRRFGNQLP